MSSWVSQVRALPVVRQRMLAGVLLALLVIILPMLLLGPLVSKHLEYARTIADAADRIERTDRSLQRLPALQARIAGLEAALEQSGHYIERSSASLAAADLQQAVSDLAEEADISIDSTDVRSPREGAHATRIGVRFNMSGEITALSELLIALERHQPLLFVEDLSVQPDSRRRRSQDPHRPVALDIRLEVGALMRGEGTR